MAFDKTQPTDTTKIRNLGVVIRPNWVAIESAESTFRPYALNLQNRTPLAVSNDPAAIADTSILYVKDDALGNPETFAIDGSSNIVQLTQNGAMGSITTPLRTQSITYDGTYLNTQDGFVSAWAIVAANGAIINTYGLSSVKNATGDYTLTFTSALSTANYVVNGTVQKNNTRARVVWVYNQTANNFSVRVQAINASAGAYEDNIFMVSVYGGR